MDRQPPAVRYVRRRYAATLAQQPQPQQQSPYSFADTSTSQAASPYSMAADPASQHMAAMQQASGYPPTPTTHANPYAASTGSPDAGYAAFDNMRTHPDQGLAYDALRNDHNAQIELYLNNADASSSFTNWLRRNAGDFYNRYTASSAQQNNPQMQFMDWLHQNNLSAQFLQQAPENRGFFEGMMNPATRWVV